MGPHVIINATRNLLQVGSSLQGSTAPARSLLQHRLPTGSQLPLGIDLLQCGMVQGLQVDLCPITDLNQENQLADRNLREPKLS